MQSAFQVILNIFLCLTCFDPPPLSPSFSPTFLCHHSQLAEQYGSDVASEVMARSRSQIHLDSMPTVNYHAQASGHSYSDSKYGSLRNVAPEGVL
jgi:hypothetical protein